MVEVEWEPRIRLLHFGGCVRVCWGLRERESVTTLAVLLLQSAICNLQSVPFYSRVSIVYCCCV